MISETSSKTLRHRIFKSPNWAIDTVDITGRVCAITGWYVSLCKREIHLNGTKMQVERSARDDLEQIFGWLEPEISVVSFQATGEFQLGADELELSLEPEGDVQKYYFPVTNPGRFALPPSDRQRRVNAIESDNKFLLAGYTAYRKMAHIFYAPNSTIRILDWGCGCGGVARHFLTDARFEYFGADIDPDNLQWCLDNLAAERFFPLPLNAVDAPALEQPMDAVFGVSVISHLDADTIRGWGNWLASTIRADGLLALTTLGLQAATKESDSLLDDLLRRGHLFGRDNHEIGRIVGNPDYYGVGLQSPAGLISLLPQFDLLHHGTGEWGHQDLFVFRRR